MRFWAEIFVTEGAGKGGYNATIEKSFYGFPFLPKKGLRIVSLDGLDEMSPSWKAKTDPNLHELDDRIEWSVELRDERLKKNLIPEIPMKDIRHAIKHGWTLERLSENEP